MRFRDFSGSFLIRHLARCRIAARSDLSAWRARVCERVDRAVTLQKWEVEAMLRIATPLPRSDSSRSDEPG